MTSYSVYVIVETEEGGDIYTDATTFLLSTDSKEYADTMAGLLETHAHELEVRWAVREEMKDGYPLGGRRDLFDAGFAAAKAGESPDAIPDYLMRGETASWYHGFFNFDYSQDDRYGMFSLGSDGYPIKFRNEDAEVARRLARKNEPKTPWSTLLELARIDRNEHRHLPNG